VILVILFPSQNEAQHSTGNGSSFKMTIMNDRQVSDKVYEFDIYLKASDPKVPFRLATMQAGILVNPVIVNGGVITATILPGTSELDADQQPKNIQFASGCIKMFTVFGKLAEHTTQHEVRGSLISSAGSGTKICRIRVTNSVAFGNAPANLAFNFEIKPYPTRVAEYINDINTQELCNALNCVVSTDNKPFNTVPGKK
jgi:hypothetical protein